ncbi:hypothetical protein ALC57_15058 [Trachymyrmex cornetzi]|uniref:Uncharacterized protein n=1 Tax=Trachymyrmex cornetzi TaxID=471704 RepID=A0A195DJW2_9HYME|nr:hypothetical protein ALC57_15058 [Trachymyrmex cornetzi]
MLCVGVYVSAREQMGDEVKGGEGTTSRVPKASTFCYAIARSWYRDSIKRRTRHHGRPINPQTQKWIMTFPAAIVHAFYYARNYVRDSWVDSRSSGRLLSAASEVFLARKPYRLLVYIDFFLKRLYLLARGSKPIHHRGIQDSGTFYQVILELRKVYRIAEVRVLTLGCFISWNLRFL